MPKSETLAAVSLRISGRVQGVGFRYFVEAKAEAAGLTGWVRNLPNGDVECEAEGPRPALEEWIEELRKGPPVSRVDGFVVEWKPPARRFSSFEIR